MTKYDAESGVGYGVMIEESVDKSDEIFDYATSKPLVEEWSQGFLKATDGKSAGNLRAMHGNIAAGKLTEIGFDDAAKRIPVAFKVVDPVEREKCAEGVYTGLSIGGSYVKRWKDEVSGKTRYTAKLAEVSLVDNPCVPGATFEYIRAAGAEPELRKFRGGEQSTAPAAPTDGPGVPAPIAKDAAPENDPPAPVKKEVDPEAVVAQAQSVIEQIRALIGQAAQMPGDPSTWTLRDLVVALEGLMGVKYEAEWVAQREADMKAAAAPLVDLVKAALAEATKAAEASLTEALTKSITDALTKVAGSTETLVQALAKAEGSGAEAAKAAVAAAKASADELQKVVADLTVRLETVEKQPAEVGHPARRVEKVLGTGTAPAGPKVTVEDVQKFLSAAKASGRLSASAMQELGIYAASQFMP